MGETFFHQVKPGLEVPLCFASVVGRSFLFGGGILEDIEFIKEILLYWKFKVAQYFVTIVGSHFQWLELHISVHSARTTTYVGYTAAYICTLF